MTLGECPKVRWEDIVPPEEGMCQYPFFGTLGLLSSLIQSPKSLSCVYLGRRHWGTLNCF